MRANSTGSTHERAKTNHWCHFYSVYATTQEYMTVFFFGTHSLHLAASQSKRCGWTTSHQSLVAVPSGGGTPAGHARQLSSVLVVPELRCALVRPVGLVHEELLTGQDSLLQ